MNKTIPLLAGTMLVAVSVPALGIANPASVFCEKMGGTLELVKTSAGDTIGLCYLPDGRIIEEWTLFRMHDGKLPEGAPG